MDASEFNQKKIYSEASGSMAVVDPNIEMIFNEFGLYEENVIDLNTQVSKEAIFVSPILNNQINESKIAEELYSNKDNIEYDNRIGYYQSLYVGHVLEDNYRENASSGGIGTWIFKELFENNLIDYVIHVKKNNAPSSKTLFKYEISDSIDEIKNGAKTRYYPVEISEVMKVVKNNPGRYAIIGIPSFIYSIRLLSKVDKVIGERVKYTIGLICGHQKSSKFAESMAFQVGIKPGYLEDIDFRHKLMDRPASSYGVKMIGIINGKSETIIKPTSELFGQNWGWGFFKPISSNFTDDVFNETADIVLGDAWLKEYISDSKGNNIVIVRNEEIDNLLKTAIRKKSVKLEIVDKETVFKSQASHFKHTHDELSYRLYKKEYEENWHPQKRVKPNKNLSSQRKKIQDLRTEISMQSHYQYQEAVQRNDYNYFVEKMTEYTKEYTLLYRKINRASKIKNLIKTNPLELFKIGYRKLVNK